MACLVRHPLARDGMDSRVSVPILQIDRARGVLASTYLTPPAQANHPIYHHYTQLSASPPVRRSAGLPSCPAASRCEVASPVRFPAFVAADLRRFCGRCAWDSHEHIDSRSVEIGKFQSFTGDLSPGIHLLSAWDRQGSRPEPTREYAYLGNTTALDQRATCFATAPSHARLHHRH